METTPFLSGDAQTSEADARQWVRDAKAAGVTGLLLAFALPWELRRAISDEASKQGMGISAQAYQRQDVVTGAVLGHWSLAHAAPETWKDDIFQLLKKTGTYWVPTLSRRWGNTVSFGERPGLRDAPLLKAVTSSGDLGLKHSWPSSGAGVREATKLAYRALLSNVEQASRGKVELLAGSGALGPNCFYGHCLHTELWHLAKAGLQPIDVLRLATLTSAEALGAAEHLGTLEAGKIADIVLLDEDPLGAIENTASISHVVIEGRVFVKGRPHELPALKPGAPAKP